MPTPVGFLRSRTDLQLAGTSVVLSVAWLVSLVLVGEAPAPVETVRVLLGAVLAPLLAIVVFVRLVAGPLALSHRQRRLLQATAAVGVIALALTANSFVAGVADSESDRPAGLFVSLAVVYVLSSIAGFAVAIAVVFFVLIRRRLSTLQSLAVAAPLAAIAAPFVAVTLLVPGSVIAASLVALAYTLLPVLSRTFTLPPAESTSVAIEPVRERVILFAGVSLAITLAVWAGGIALSVANTGTDVATSSLGYASAAGQLAAIPLLWAVSLLVGLRRPATTATARLGVAVASATVAGAAIAMIVGYSTDGDRFILLAGVIGLGVGFWAATVVWALYPAFSTPARLAVGAVVAIGGAMAYAMVVALTGGIVLAIASGFLAFGGSRVLLRPHEPATGGGRPGES